VCSVKVDVVGVDPLAAVENLEGDDDVVGAAKNRNASFLLARAVLSVAQQSESDHDDVDLSV
jgi:hypothetical protein